MKIGPAYHDFTTPVPMRVLAVDWGDAWVGARVRRCYKKNGSPHPALCANGLDIDLCPLPFVRLRFRITKGGGRWGR